MDAQKSMREDPAIQIGSDFPFDKASNRRALPSRPSQEGLELFANDFVEKGLLGFMAFVLDGGRESTGTMGWSAANVNASNVPSDRNERP